MTNNLFRNTIRQGAQYPEGIIGILKIIGCYITAFTFELTVRLFGMYLLFPVFIPISALLVILGTVIGFYYGIMALIDWFKNIGKSKKSKNVYPSGLVLTIAIFSFLLSIFCPILFIWILQ